MSRFRFLLIPAALLLMGFMAFRTIQDWAPPGFFWWEEPPVYYEAGVSCDYLLRSQLIVQPNVRDAAGFMLVVDQINLQRHECGPFYWRPWPIAPFEEDVSSACWPGAWFTNEGGFQGTGGDDGRIGDGLAPAGLRAGGVMEGEVLAWSWKDDAGNILVYFSPEAESGPYDGAACWAVRPGSPGMV